MKRMPTKMILCILTLSLLMPTVASIGAENITFAQEKKVEVKESDYYIKEFSDKLSKSEQRYIYQTARDYGLEYELVLAICKVESNFNKYCISESNDFSIMQVNGYWTKPLTEEFGYKIDLMDFKTNVRAGCHILAQNFKDWKKYEKESLEKYYYLSINSYNHGTSAIKRKYVVSRGKDIKTREYGQLVMDTFYKYLDGEYDYEPRD